jgi:phospholipid:diacylglycerol acyltransferase
MPGISSMLPIGGNAVWGNATWAPDDLPEQNVSFGTFLNFKENNGSAHYRNLTVEQSFNYLMDVSEDWYNDQVKGSYSRGVAHTTAEVEANEKDSRKWINPLETRLPLAPSLKIYCFYGKFPSTNHFLWTLCTDESRNRQTDGTLLLLPQTRQPALIP